MAKQATNKRSKPMMKNKLTATVGGEKVSTVFTDNDKDATAHVTMLNMLYGNTVTVEVEKVKKSAAKSAPKNPPKINDDHPRG